MLNNEIITKLTSLCSLDADAIKSYDEALKSIAEKELTLVLKGYRDDHARHVESIKDIIVDLGGAPPLGGGDLRGFFITGMQHTNV
jgi:hypothetical protein